MGFDPLRAVERVILIYLSAVILVLRTVGMVVAPNSASTLTHNSIKKANDCLRAIFRCYGKPGQLVEAIGKENLCGLRTD